MLVVICIVIILIVVFILWKKNPQKDKVLPATNFKLTYLGKENFMEKYRGAWIPSVSGFSDRQQILVGLDDATPAILPDCDSLDASLDTYDFTFPTGAKVVIVIRTIGDNESFDDLIVPQFTATNQEKVKPATNFVLEYLGHID
jgi:hypothetical protein